MITLTLTLVRLYIAQSNNNKPTVEIEIRATCAGRGLKGTGSIKSLFERNPRCEQARFPIVYREKAEIIISGHARCAQILLINKV